MEVRSLSFLNELHENVISKGSVNNVSKITIRYYYKKIYNKELPHGCAPCYNNALVSMRKFYVGHIDKYKLEDTAIIKLKRQELSVALHHYKSQEKYELCEFIKGRIDIYKKLI